MSQKVSLLNQDFEYDIHFSSKMSHVAKRVTSSDTKTGSKPVCFSESMLNAVEKLFQDNCKETFFFHFNR